MNAESPVCVIVGAGPGNGRAFAHRFAQGGYRVALLARDKARLEKMAAEIPGAIGVRCDVQDAANVQTAFDAVRERLGPVSAVVYNAGAGKFGALAELSIEDFESAWRTNAYGCFVAAKSIAPDLRACGGQFIIIGATASLKGGANFAAFASAKGALRNLAQSLARQLGPDGVHVAHVVIDGVIDLARTRKAMPDKPDDYFLKPAAIAESVFALTQQDKSAWTFELDLRPYAEKW